MYHRIIFLLAGLFPALMLAQVPAYDHHPVTGHIPCATTQYEAELRQRFPDRPTRAEFERWLQQVAATTVEPRDPVVTIPVIVHVIYPDGTAIGRGANIPYSQITTQIDVLNEDFRRKAGTPGFNNDSVGADAEIEFCLAYVDPDGFRLNEIGVMRYSDAELNLPPMGQGYSRNIIQTRIKPQTQWDPTQYFNIWVVPINDQAGGGLGQILGYAQFPDLSNLTGLPGTGGAAATDGIAVNSAAFGKGGFTSPPTDRGRTLTHEFGHALGLIHIWGDGDCTRDDFCGDTPNSDAPNFGCPTGHVSCSTPDMTNNYMDYGDGRCLNIFTQCQKSRMRTVLINSPRRRELINSTVCQVPTQAPIAAFTQLDTLTCDGTVRFQDNSNQYPTNFRWVVEGTDTIQARNLSYKFDSTGTYQVQLIVRNFLGADTLTRNVSIVVSEASSLDLGPDLEFCSQGGATTVRLTAQVSDPAITVRWSPTTFLDDPNSKTPLFTGFSSQTYFATATAPDGCTFSDTLQVDVFPQLIISAGQDKIFYKDSLPFVQLNASGVNVASWNWRPNVGFVPPSNPNVRNPRVAPDSTTLYTLTAIDGNNCIANDSVLVTVIPIVRDTMGDDTTVSVGPTLENGLGRVLAPYPIPAQSTLHFGADLREAGNLTLDLYDFAGRRLRQLYQGYTRRGEFAFTWQRDADISPGTYLVVWRMNDRRLLQKIVLK